MRMRCVRRLMELVSGHPGRIRRRRKVREGKVKGRRTIREKWPHERSHNVRTRGKGEVCVRRIWRPVTYRHGAIASRRWGKSRGYSYRQVN